VLFMILRINSSNPSNSTNQLAFIMDTQCVLCDVETECLNIRDELHASNSSILGFYKYQDLSLTKITSFVMANELLLFAEN
jgi:hypothetical protein